MYQERIHCLGIWTLEECRNHADLLAMFKMYKGLIFVSSVVSSTSAVLSWIHGDTPQTWWRLTVRWTFDDSSSLKGLLRWNYLNQEAIDSGTVQVRPHLASFLLLFSQYLCKHSYVYCWNLTVCVAGSQIFPHLDGEMFNMSTQHLKFQLYLLNTI